MITLSETFKACSCEGGGVSIMRSNNRGCLLMLTFIQAVIEAGSH
jgi:hypothetical protein